jgi:DNA-directed RNA polymerase
MYRGKSEQRAKVYLKGRRVELVITPNDGKTLNTMAQVNGIAPNFVHSLDASHLMSVANRCWERGVYALAVVHDSFGTHAADAATLSIVLRETFVDQYEPDVLARFRDELIDQLPPEFAEKLPPLPPFGDFDIRSVLNAEYVFS